jgi:hypothetical protein
MVVVELGSSYALTGGSHLTFLKKLGDKIVQVGTTNEEVLEVLLHREAEAFKALPSRESIRALHLLRETLVTFRLRTARRVAAKVEGTLQPRADTFKPTDTSLSIVAPFGIDEIDYGPIGNARTLPPERHAEIWGSISLPNTRTLFTETPSEALELTT